MRRFSIVVGLGLGVVAVAALGPVACGSEGTSVFSNGLEDAGASEEDGASFADVGAGEPSGGCRNLQCYQKACPAGSAAETTTIRGHVFDPRGVNPLYNVMVYIPNGTVEPFDDTKGVTCDRCSGAFATGDPLVMDVSKSDGSFELTNVPVGIALPIVVQVGKWRRTFTLPAVEACAVHQASEDKDDPLMFRLPRNAGEGHIPRIAIALGRADPLECLLRKVGIDDAEFTLPTAEGRAHLYRAASASLSDGLEPQLDYGAFSAEAGQRFPGVNTLWGETATLSRYDVSLLPCEGTSSNSGKTSDLRQTQATYDNVRDYLHLGGRVFVTHYSRTFLDGHRAGGSAINTNIPSHFGSVGNFRVVENDRSDKRAIINNSSGASRVCSKGGSCQAASGETAYDAKLELLATVDRSFPKGQAFAEWLQTTSASAELGRLPIIDWRHDLESPAGPPISQPWIVANTYDGWPTKAAGDAAGAGDVVQHLTFNTPLDAGVDDAGEPNQCGKVVFSDFHVSAGARNNNKFFPESCGDAATPMTPQEKALEFMLFDLAACIQREDAPPPRPK